MILRRNPRRAEEMRATRRSKLDFLKLKVQETNQYLASRPKAKVDLALAKLQSKASDLKVNGWVKVLSRERTLILETDPSALEEEQKLDGCYVLKTDLPQEAAAPSVIHDRYKDLALVEQAFRTGKQRHLEMRPVYVQKESSTRGHALVVMLAYQIVRHLQRAWVDIDQTVEEGLRDLSTICSIEVAVKGQASCHKIPTPRSTSAQLLKSLNIQLPEALPQLNARVVSRKKLQSQRKRVDL